MDCLRDKRLYLPFRGQVEGPLYTVQGRRYMIPKRPIRGGGRQRSKDTSVHHDGYEVHQKGDGDKDETRIINGSNRRGDQTPTRTRRQTLARLHNLHERQPFRLPQGR
jgi:hypothetical protein